MNGISQTGVKFFSLCICNVSQGFILSLRPLSCETASQNQGEMCGDKRAGLGSPAEHHTHDTGRGDWTSSPPQTPYPWRKLEHLYKMTITRCLFCMYQNHVFQLIGKLLQCFFLVPRTELNILCGLISAENERNIICLF